MRGVACVEAGGLCSYVAVHASLPRILQAGSISVPFEVGVDAAPVKVQQRLPIFPMPCGCYVMPAIIDPEDNIRYLLGGS